MYKSVDTDMNNLLNVYSMKHKIKRAIRCVQPIICITK